MTKRSRDKALLFAVFFAILSIFLAVGYFSFFRKSADLASVIDYISTQATITFKDSTGNTYTEQSNISKVRKVELFDLRVGLKGRSGAKLTAKDLVMTLINPETAEGIGKVSFKVGESGEGKPDWTNISQADADKSYDIKVSTSGYLPRKIEGVTLGSASAVDLGSLRPGDLNGDGAINIEDYVSWKAAYGQNVTNNPRDFNSDGKVDFYDFAMSFGSCYNVNTVSQDTLCK